MAFRPLHWSADSHSSAAPPFSFVLVFDTFKCRFRHCQGGEDEEFDGMGWGTAESNRDYMPLVHTHPKSDAGTIKWESPAARFAVAKQRGFTLGW